MPLLHFKILRRSHIECGSLVYPEVWRAAALLPPGLASQVLNGKLWTTNRKPQTANRTPCLWERLQALYNVFL